MNWQLTGMAAAVVFCGVAAVALFGAHLTAAAARLTELSRQHPFRGAALLFLAGLMVAYGGSKPTEGYTVRYHYNTASSQAVRDQSFKCGEAGRLLLKDSQLGWGDPAGYSFAGWAKSPSAAEAEYADGEEVVDIAAAGGTAHLYAVWRGNEYTVKFDANGGTGETEDQKFVYGAAQRLNASGFSRAGWAFAGWATNAAGTAVYEARQNVSNLTDAAGGEVVLFGTWTPGDYTVVFDAGGGEGTMKDQVFSYGAAQPLSPNAFSRSGWSFAGWATESGAAAEYADEATVSNLTETAGGRVSLFATWVVDLCTVTFDPNGGEGGGEKELVRGSELGELPAASRDGYIFGGWFTERKGGSAATPATKVDGDAEYYAHWSEPATHTLTVKPNKTKFGTVSGGGRYPEGKKAKLKAKAKSGFAFAGWFTDKKCKNELNPEGYDNRNASVKYAMPAGKTTIYAKFVTKAADKKALKFSAATKKLAKTPAKATAGKAFTLKLGISSASLPKATAKSLPKGLTIDRTTGKISGTPAKPGSYTATVTVKSAAGNVITQKVKITVKVPGWAGGAFYGYAFPKTMKETDEAYLTFTVSSVGKVSGKVIYKDKNYRFKSSYSSCSATNAAFAPAVKIGKTKFKPKGGVKVRKVNADGVDLTQASDGSGGFSALKYVPLVKKGKPLSPLIGSTYTFTGKTKNSGLKKSKDKLKVKLGAGDSVKITGVVNGKAITAVSWTLSNYGKRTEGSGTVYTGFTDIIIPAAKYVRTLTFEATVDAAGEVTGVETSFE
ncbi:MAG: InlB B-repeat-containing protein [Kiritimatiellae bacterium]|nr:InlB B-repeat-containing protein [Kiritimatiellia bacterium]